jgi:hypothetical protein
VPVEGVLSFISLPTASPAALSSPIEHDLAGPDGEGSRPGRRDSDSSEDAPAKKSLAASDTAEMACTCEGMKAHMASAKRTAGLQGPAPRRSGVAGGVAPRAGLLADIFGEQGPTPEAVADARTVDGRGRVQLSESMSALRWEPGAKVSVSAHSSGVLTLTPWSGATVTETVATFDSRGRVCLPRWARELAALAPGAALLAVADLGSERLSLVGAAAFMRLAAAVAA